MAGRLFGLGVGPGDPDLISLKALKLLHQAKTVAYPTGRHGGGNAYNIVKPHLRDDQELLAMVYPTTAGAVADSPSYPKLMANFYDETSDQLAARLDAGKDVAIICQGDPFFYGSYMYWHARLAEQYDTIVVPGISSVMAAPAILGTPLCHRTDTVTIVPATLTEEEIRSRLEAADSAVIMKLGRTLNKVKKVLDQAGLTEKAYLVERATMEGERIRSLLDDDIQTAGYFSIVIIPCTKPE